MKVVLSC